MQVERAIYKDNDGDYIYSTLDMTLPQDKHTTHYVQKYICDDFIRMYPKNFLKEFTRSNLKKDYIGMVIDSDLDKAVLELKTFPTHLIDDESKAYVDVLGVSEQREKEQMNNGNI